MIVYKFGGASVQSAAGVKNLYSIISNKEEMVVVVSAMGKTTNAMEEVLSHHFEGNTSGALGRLSEVKAYHQAIITDLDMSGLKSVDSLFAELQKFISLGCCTTCSFEELYDKVVSYGEMFSTAIISEYLKKMGIANHLIDMRKTLITDPKFRAASINYEASTLNLKHEIAEHKATIYIAQGFIGGTPKGEPTTLGREGSDYSAAAIASMLDAKSVTIWKDVDGILNADPRLFSSTQLIKQLSYIDAVELAYSGAQIIHPKTIKPLQNKAIPLFVKPFNNPTAEGSVIKDSADYISPTMPVLILKQNQILLSIGLQDFSFVLEESLQQIIILLNRYNQKINLVQSSAIKITICIDKSRYFNDIIKDLSRNFIVKYNDNLELLTIRGYTDEVLEQQTEGRTIYIKQQTRRSVRLLRNKL